MRYIVLSIEEGIDSHWMNHMDIILNTDDFLEAVKVLYARGERIIDTEEGVIMRDGSDAVEKVYHEFKWYIIADRPTHGIGNFGTPKCIVCGQNNQ